MGKTESLNARPAHITEAEWEVRLQLAATYHLFDYLGWTEGIFNHISARVPGPERHFLMNPYGLHYAEVTASNLVKVDIHGANVEPGPYKGNVAGFAIHGAIHEHRDDAHCVIHTHTTAGAVVAGKEGGLRNDNFNSALLTGLVAYHDFEGVTVRSDERPRLVKSLGTKNYLILRNHGLCAIGPNIPQAVRNYWNLQRACEIQVASDAAGGADRVLTPAVRQQAMLDSKKFDESGTTARLFFDGMLRRMEIDRSRAWVDYRT